MAWRSARPQGGPGTNRLSKIECVLGTWMSQNASRDRRHAWPADEDAKRAVYRESLGAAYSDFVNSDAQTEKVFRVFHRHEPQTPVVTLDALLQRTEHG